MSLVSTRVPRAPSKMGVPLPQLLSVLLLKAHIMFSAAGSFPAPWDPYPATDLGGVYQSPPAGQASGRSDTRMPSAPPSSLQAPAEVSPPLGAHSCLNPRPGPSRFPGSHSVNDLHIAPHVGLSFQRTQARTLSGVPASLLHGWSCRGLAPSLSHAHPLVPCTSPSPFLVTPYPGR